MTEHVRGVYGGSFGYTEVPDDEYGCPDVLEFELNVDKAIILDIKEETDKKIKKSEEFKARKIAEYAALRNTRTQTPLNYVKRF
jgi:hypothetical protein